MNSQEQFKKNKYVVFDDVLSKETCEILTNYMFLKRDAGYLEPPVALGGDDTQCPKSWSIYGDPLFDTLLSQFSKPIGNLLGIDLIPAYTYARLYEPGEILTWHVDRPSCEISGTMTLGFKGNDIWPIYIGQPGASKEDKVGIPIDIGVGELMMYSGCEVPHWRDEFEGEWQVQVFIHYVRADGPYAKDHAFDGRKHLGIFKNSEEYKKQAERIAKFVNSDIPISLPKPDKQNVKIDSTKPFKFEV